MHNSNQLMASQNILYNFFKRISIVIFPPKSRVFKAHFEEPSTLENQDLQWTPWYSGVPFKMAFLVPWALKN